MYGEGKASIQVAAPPERVWALVADVPNMGRWSPECYQCEWLGGATGPAVGARFRGHNRQGFMKWTADCEVTACTPGEEFAFHTFEGGEPATNWRFRFRPVDGGTEVEESYEWLRAVLILRLLYPLIGRQRNARLVTAMQQTLERIKTAAESA